MYRTYAAHVRHYLVNTWSGDVLVLQLHSKLHVQHVEFNGLVVVLHESVRVAQTVA